MQLRPISHQGLMCLAWFRSYFHNWNPALVDIPRRWQHQVALFFNFIFIYLHVFIYYTYKCKFSFNIRLLGNKYHLCKEGPLHCIGAKKSLFKKLLLLLILYLRVLTVFSVLKVHVPLTSILFFYYGTRFRVEKS